MTLLLTSTLLGGCASKERHVEITDAWARPAGVGENSAIYFHITSYNADDALLDAEASVAMKTELHRSIMDDEGTMSMVHQERISLPAGQTIEFLPGGLHIMLMGLKEELRPGDEIAVRLILQASGEMVIDVPVQNP